MAYVSAIQPRRLATPGRRQVLASGAVRREVKCSFCRTKLGEVTLWPDGDKSFKPVEELAMDQAGCFRPYSGAKLTAAERAAMRPPVIELPVSVDHLPRGSKSTHLVVISRDFEV